MPEPKKRWYDFLRDIAPSIDPTSPVNPTDPGVPTSGPDSRSFFNNPFTSFVRDNWQYFAYGSGVIIVFGVAIYYWDPISSGFVYVGSSIKTGVGYVGSSIKSGFDYVVGFFSGGGRGGTGAAPAPAASQPGDITLEELTSVAPNDATGAEVLLDSPASLKSKADSLRERVEAQMKAIADAQGPVDPYHVPTTKEEALAAALEKMPKTPDLVTPKSLAGTDVFAQWETNPPITQTVDVSSSVRLTPTQSPNPWGIYNRTQQILAESYADQSAGLAGSSLPANLQSAASPSSSGLQLQGMDPLGVQAKVQASPVLSGLGLSPESFAGPSGPKYFPPKGSEAFGVDVPAPSSSVPGGLGKGKSQWVQDNPFPTGQEGLGSPASDAGSDIEVFVSRRVKYYPGIREDVRAYIAQGEPTLCKFFNIENFDDPLRYYAIQEAERLRYRFYTGLQAPVDQSSSRALWHSLTRG